MDIIKHRNCVYPAGMNSALMAFCRVWQLLFVSNDARWSSLASGGATTHPQLCPLGSVENSLLYSICFPCHVFSQLLPVYMLLRIYVTMYYSTYVLWIFKLWEESHSSWTFIHEGKKEFLKTNDTKISLSSSVDLMGVSQVSALLYQTCDHAWCFPNVSGPIGKSLEQKWRYCSYCHSSRWGAPRAGWSPASRRNAPLGLSQGEPGMCSPADRATSRAWCSGPRRAFVGSHPDEQLWLYQSPGAAVVNLWPWAKQGVLLVYGVVSRFDAPLLFMTNEYQEDQRQQQW